MGGRLDTTNVLEKPSACVITSISMDHTQYLGDTLIKIAREKAGIIKKWTPVIFAGRQREISAVIEGQAFRAGSARYPVGREDFRVEDVGDGWLEISARMLQGDRLKLKIPFEAFYQAENTMLAVRTLDVLRWEGRMLTEEQESQWNSPAESESRLLPEFIWTEPIIREGSALFWRRQGRLKRGWEGSRICCLALYLIRIIRLWPGSFAAASTGRLSVWFISTAKEEWRLAPL